MGARRPATTPVTLPVAATALPAAVFAFPQASGGLHAPPRPSFLRDAKRCPAIMKRYALEAPAEPGRGHRMGSPCMGLFRSCPLAACMRVF